MYIAPVLFVNIMKVYSVERLSLDLFGIHSVLLSFLHFSILYFIFYWHIIAWWCCASFCWTNKLINYMNIHSLSLLSLPPIPIPLIKVITEHQAEVFLIVGGQNPRHQLMCSLCNNFPSPKEECWPWRSGSRRSFSPPGLWRESCPAPHVPELLSEPLSHWGDSAGRRPSQEHQHTAVRGSARGTACGEEGSGSEVIVVVF